MNFEGRKPFSIVLALSWPIFIEFFLQFLLGFMDMYILSYFSDKAVGAVGFANQIIQILTIVLKIAGTGATILISQNLGAKNLGRAAGIAIIAILFNFILGTILAPLFIFCSPFWVSLMNCPEELKLLSVQFLSVIGGTFVIRALYFALSSVLYSYGYTRVSMIISFMMNILNVVGGWLVIFGPFGLPVFGVVGVAWVTVISSMIGLISITLFSIKALKLHHYLREVSGSFVRHMLQLIKLGVPVTMEQLVYNLGQVTMTAFIGLMGTIAVATRIYANSIMWMMEMFIYCTSIGLQIYAARLIGMGKKEEVEKICYKMVRFGWLINLCLPVLVFFLSDRIFGIFTHDQQIITVAKVLMAMAIVLVPCKVLSTQISSTLKSAGDVRFSLVVSVIFMWCFSLPLSYYLSITLHWGLPGIWMVCISDELIRGFIILWRFKKGKWKTIDLLKTAPVTV